MRGLLNRKGDMIHMPARRVVTVNSANPSTATISVDDVLPNRSTIHESCFSDPLSSSISIPAHTRSTQSKKARYQSIFRLPRKELPIKSCVGEPSAWETWCKVETSKVKKR